MSWWLLLPNIQNCSGPFWDTPVEELRKTTDAGPDRYLSSNCLTRNSQITDIYTGAYEQITH
jgi:hypothetical protein